MTLYYYGIDNNLGGLESFAKSLLPHIVNNGIRVTIISCYHDYAYREYFESLGVQSIIVPNYRKSPFHYYKSLVTIFKNHNIKDVVHINIMSFKNFFLFKAISKTNINTVISGHASSTTGSVIEKLLHRYGRFKYRNLGTCVVEEKNTFMFHKSVKTVVIHNGFEIEKFFFDSVKREQIRKKYDMNGHIAIGLVGRVSPLKNQIFAVRIFEQLDKNKYHLHLFGKNQDNDTVNYIFNKHLPNVHYHGEIIDNQKIYNGLDLLIMPSISEGFGLVMYEALSNGLNVLISDNVPYPEHISNNVHQLPLDIDIWVKEILNLKKSRTTKPVDGIDKYDSISMAKQYLQIYNKIN